MDEKLKSSEKMEIQRIQFYDNRENSICWWGSCFMIESSASTQRTVWCFFIIITKLILQKTVFWKYFFILLNVNFSHLIICEQLLDIKTPLNCVNCTSLRGSAALWSLTREAGWPWRCSWERGRQPCVSRPAGVRSLAPLHFLILHHRPAAEAGRFGKSHDGILTRA